MLRTDHLFAAIGRRVAAGLLPDAAAPQIAAVRAVPTVVEIDIADTAAVRTGAPVRLSGAPARRRGDDLDGMIVDTGSVACRGTGAASGGRRGLLRSRLAFA